MQGRATTKSPSARPQGGELELAELLRRGPARRPARGRCWGEVRGRAAGNKAMMRWMGEWGRAVGNRVLRKGRRLWDTAWVCRAMSQDLRACVRACMATLHGAHSIACMRPLAPCGSHALPHGLKSSCAMHASARIYTCTDTRMHACMHTCTHAHAGSTSQGRNPTCLDQIQPKIQRTV